MLSNIVKLSLESLLVLLAAVPLFLPVGNPLTPSLPVATPWHPRPFSVVCISRFSGLSFVLGATYLLQRLVCKMTKWMVRSAALHLAARGPSIILGASLDSSEFRQNSLGFTIRIFLHKMVHNAMSNELGKNEANIGFCIQILVCCDGFVLYACPKEIMKIYF